MSVVPGLLPLHVENDMWNEYTLLLGPVLYNHPLFSADFIYITRYHYSTLYV